MFSFFCEKINPLIRSFYKTITVVKKRSTRNSKAVLCKGGSWANSINTPQELVPDTYPQNNVNPQTHNIKNSIIPSPLWVPDTHSSPRTTALGALFS